MKNESDQSDLRDEGEGKKRSNEGMDRRMMKIN